MSVPLIRLLHLASPTLPVGASPEVTERGAQRLRGERAFVFSNRKAGRGMDSVIAFIRQAGMPGSASRL
jgi:Ni2+-binding GTPase involved in maturation of urease and hydrogenase